jgi:hypothetical protein
MNARKNFEVSAFRVYTNVGPMWEARYWYAGGHHPHGMWHTLGDEQYFKLSGDAIAHGRDTLISMGHVKEQSK